ncbi:hypothetical protein [Emticicia sp. BO119]|uniref:hypothetical protein n=1 Tax=Emticicia sp. BO119 TaxID=2757768 RepID=UPI0015F0ADE0|nr:hypothetical protein [Emticicia sp. BO119]MBA4854033.1 hypothetical protein [Emticicia sp. BO119]
MKTCSLIANIIMLVILIPSALGAIMSPFVFDSGASNRTWWIFGTLVALPILIILSQIVSWIAYVRHNYDFAFKVSLLPVLDILMIIVLFAVSSDLK